MINLKKTNNGITLIALVITIVVLIILAGISIGAITGNHRYYRSSSKCKRRYRDCRWKGKNTVSYSKSYRKRWNRRFETKLF